MNLTQTTDVIKARGGNLGDMLSSESRNTPRSRTTLSLWLDVTESNLNRLVNALTFDEIGTQCLIATLHSVVYLQGGTEKTRLLLRVDKLVMVNGRKPCDVSKVSEFCLENA